MDRLEETMETRNSGFNLHSFGIRNTNLRVSRDATEKRERETRRAQIRRGRDPMRASLSHIFHLPPTHLCSKELSSWVRSLLPRTWYPTITSPTEQQGQSDVLHYQGVHQTSEPTELPHLSEPLHRFQHRSPSNHFIRFFGARPLPTPHQE